MLNTIIAVYVGISLFEFVKSIKLSIKNNTIDEDIERNWKQLKETCYYMKVELLRKKNRKENGK